MALMLDPQGQDTGTAWIYTQCHTATGWACLTQARHHDIIAVGEHGPWAEQARARGWIAVETDLCLAIGVDSLARRIIGERVRVFHPLTAMPTKHILPSTARLLAALGRAQATVERIVLGGSACVWRQRRHRWGVGDDTPTHTPRAARAWAYMGAERLAEAAAGPALVRLRAAPVWDAPERGLAKRLARPWIPQPKAGRAVLDPLCLSDMAAATAQAMHAPPEVAGHVFGLPGPQAYQARILAQAAGARVFAAPAEVSEMLGRIGILGWDRDAAMAMAWSLTLSGVGARNMLGWEAQEVPALDQKKTHQLAP